MKSSKNVMVWEDSVSLEVNEEPKFKYEPNFTITQVKLSLQNAIILSKINDLPTQEQLKSTNITQNNIIFINNIEKSDMDKTNIIINNIFPREEPNTLTLERLNSCKSDKYCAKDSVENSNSNERPMHKSSFRDKSPSPFKSGKRVSFNSQIVVFKTDGIENFDTKEGKLSHFSNKKSNNKKKTCKSCGLF